MQNVGNENIAEVDTIELRTTKQQNNAFNSITWLRAIATFFITNSHMATLWGKYPYLSFGGLFGNCLFFFISGFCLANLKLDFLPWCWHRVKRISLPYFIFLPLLLLNGYVFKSLFYLIFPIEPYHFLPTILTLYPIYYLIAKYIKNVKSLLFAIGLNCVLQIIYFVYNSSTIGSMTEHYTMLGLLSYFIFMIIGFGYRKFGFKIGFKYGLCGSIVFFILYGLQSFMPLQGVWRILQWYLALGFVICLSNLFLSLENKLKNNVRFIDLLATHTLEIYIVQVLLIRCFCYLNFPVGLLLAWGAIIGNAVILKRITNMIIEYLVYHRKDCLMNNEKLL